jgi:GNAT superfamily N-acetyltransferase
MTDLGMASAPIRVAALTGPALVAALPELARLRIAVFRAYPYLYDGDPAYEEAYLAAYEASRGAIIVGAFAGDQLVGAATGAPMEDHAQAFSAPFESRGYDLRDIFYLGESVLLPQWRGRGIGHAFFDHREARARELGRRWSCFCAVVRADDHPARPTDYRPLDPLWIKRGYAQVPGLMTSFAWKEVDAAGSTDKPMQFWMRAL